MLYFPSLQGPYCLISNPLPCHAHCIILTRINATQKCSIKCSSFVQVLTGEDWNVVMYDGIQAYDGVKVIICPNIVLN